MNQEYIAALLQRLDAVPGVSGFEEAVGRQIAQELTGCDAAASVDALGSRLFTRQGGPEPPLLLFAGMDEPGYLIGGFSPGGQALALPAGEKLPPKGADYCIHTAAGPIPAICGCPDLRLPLPLHIGARSRRGAQNRGVAIGDPVTPDRQGRLIGKTGFTGRAVESRAGCAALVATLRLCAGMPAGRTVIACAAAQHEWEGRGIRAVLREIRPALALGFTACPGGEEGSEGSLPIPGAGPALCLCGLPPALREGICAAARRRHLPLQLQALPAATGSLPPGLPVAVLGIPVRYPRSPAPLVDTGDILAAAQLAATFLQEPDIC